MNVTAWSRSRRLFCFGSHPSVGWQRSRSKWVLGNPSTWLPGLPQVCPHLTDPQVTPSHLRAGWVHTVFYWISPGHLDASSCYPLPNPGLCSQGPQLGAAGPAPVFSQGLPTGPSPQQTPSSCHLPLCQAVLAGAHSCSGTVQLLCGTGSGTKLTGSAPSSGHIRPSTVQHSTMGSDLQLRVEVKREVGCSIGCGRWHVPCR